MQTSKISFGASNILSRTGKSSKKPVRVLYGLKPMEDYSITKPTLYVNKSIKYVTNVLKNLKGMFK